MRTETLQMISMQIVRDRKRSERALLIGIDGADGSGKSYFAMELAEELRTAGLQADVFSIDDFHNERAVRYRKGRSSPVGFFEDSHNLDMLRSGLLAPVKQGKSKIMSKCFDCEADVQRLSYLDISSLDAVIFEGMFLHRDELSGYWDCSIFLDTEFPVSVARGNARFGLNPDPGHESNARYVKGNMIYRARCSPISRADIVVDNNNLESATIISSQYNQ